MKLNLVEMILNFSQEKKQILHTCQFLLKKKMAVSTRELTKLIDRSSLTPTAVLPALLRYRLIQWQQIMASGKQVQSFDPFTSFAKKKKQNLN